MSRPRPRWARNEAAFHRYGLLPRYLVDISKIDQSTTLFGRTWDSPFGFAPTGAAGLFRMGSDLMLAAAAAKANVPYIMSGASNDTLEDAARIAPEQTWYQAYAARDGKITEDMIRRSADAGLGALVLTVDVPIRPKRERNVRNSYSHDLRKITPGRVVDGLLHPFWTYEFLRNGGAPTLGNWAPYAPPGSDVHGVIDFVGTQTPASSQTWRELETYRRLWQGPLIVKGILHPDDAIRAADLGAEGIIVSNHGGRQLDRAPSTIDAFPAIKAAVGNRVVLMLDSGVRARRRHHHRPLPGRGIRIRRPCRRLRRRRRRRSGGDAHHRHSARTAHHQSGTDGHHRDRPAGAALSDGDRLALKGASRCCAGRPRYR